MKDCGVRYRERILNLDCHVATLLAMTGTATPIVIAKPVRTLAVAISELPNLYNFFRLYRPPLRGRWTHVSTLQNVYVRWL